MPKSFGPIQVIPPGLLGFLNLKSHGENPDTMGSEYQPTIELGEWLLQRDYELVGGTAMTLVTANLGSRPFTGGVLSSPVPADEWWYVHEFCVFSVVIAVGDTVGGAVAWRIGDPGNFGISIHGPHEVFAGAANKVALFRSDQPFFAPAGSQLALYVTQATFAVNLGLAGWARITRLPV